VSIDERRRLDLADAVKRALGDEAGITLMEMLPPVGWADVATRFDVEAQRVATGDDLSALRREMRSELATLRREMSSELATLRREMSSELAAVRQEMSSGLASVRHDMRELELKLDARFERGFRQVMVTMSTLMVAGFAATVGASLIR
jgi:hypothetical protein